MRVVLPMLVLLTVSACHNYEMDKLDASENKELVVPPCLEKGE